MNQLNRHMAQPEPQVDANEVQSDPLTTEPRQSVPQNTMQHIRSVVTNFFKKED